MINIILCGGSGTRLWPISRTLMPKQFMKIFGNKSLFQLTVDRNSKICDTKIIVSNSDQYFIAAEQLQELNLTKSKYLLEPIGRNTAPAIALACFAINPEDLVLVTPSDHLIKDEIEYLKILKRAEKIALKDNLVTFGIIPTSPQVGFGYIESENTKIKNQNFCAYDVKSFHEKPDFETAIEYLNAGNYYWNSGIYMFKAGVFLDELKKHSPEIYKTSLQAFNNTQEDNSGLIRIEQEYMMNIPQISIDYAVMEKSKNIKVLPSCIEWSDVGSFDSLYNELLKDNDGNTKNYNHISVNSKNNLVYGKARKIATVDIEDCIIVDTSDALLISKKGSSHKLKEVVERIKNDNIELSYTHLETYRPWGTYTVLEHAPGYKIKRIEVKPGCRLSLQKHLHRSEHWIVVSGIATVTIGTETRLIGPNESTYIKIGEVHRLSNESKAPVILIEVQVGEYTEEDDIIRIEDDFKR